MRKVYYAIEKAEQRFWEKQWKQASLEDALKYCEIDYLHPIFLKYFSTTGPILDGGCGLGQHVVYYQNQGYEIYGMDWVIEPLSRVKQHRASAKVLVGDVSQLPFKSKAFKVYFSGGVLEYFEGGPFQLLREAHRVIDDDGLLLVTAPYLNVKRRLEDFFHFVFKRKPFKPSRRVDGVEVVYKRQKVAGEDKTFLDGYYFHQYMFRRRELARLLENSGFRVLRANGVAIQWGLMEFSWVRALYHRLQGERSTGGESPDGGGKQPNLNGRKAHLRAGVRRHLKDFLVSESSDSLLSKPLLWLLRTLVGHLIIFVCQKVS